MEGGGQKTSLDSTITPNSPSQLLLEAAAASQQLLGVFEAIDW